MNCEQTEELFSDFYDASLTPEQGGEMESHLRTCGGCLTEYRHFEKSLRSLRSTSMLETSTVFAAGVLAEARKTAADAAAPRRRSWLWIPAAAAAALAFVAGLLLRRAPEERVRVETVEKAGTEKVVEREITPADEEKILAKHNLVRWGDTYLPRPMKENFDTGLVCIGGVMMTKEDAFQQLFKDRKPVDVVPTTDIDAELARRGYVKVGKNYVHQDWLDRLTKGDILVGPNRWKSADEFKKEFMAEHNLVEYKGSIMSREHRDELLAQRILRRPELATVDNDVTAALIGLEIGPPSSYRNLTIYPVLSAREEKEPAFVSLHASLDGGKVDLLDSGSPFEIRVVNSGERAVLLLEGEVLVGGRYARVVAADTLVPSRKQADVPVYCVEPNALRKDERFTTASGHYFAAYGLRRVLLAGYGQGACWSQLTRQIEITGGKARSQPEVYRQVSSDIFEFRAYFADLPERFPDAVGIVIAVGESVESAELYANRSVFASYFDRILSAAALEASLRARDKGALYRPSRVPNSLAGVRQVLEHPFFSKTVGRDDTVLLRREGRTIGRAFLEDDKLVRLLLFAEMPSGEPDWRAAVKVPPEKLKRVLDDIDRRVREGDALSRSMAAQEMALLNFKEATAKLIGHLADPDPPVRRAIILALGMRQDARALPALVDLMEKSRKEPVIYESAVFAIARSGDEKAVEPLLKQLDGDADAARIVILQLPQLLLQLKEPQPLERAVTKIIHLQEEADAIQKGVAPTARWAAADAANILLAARAALEGVTGSTFDSPAHAREWWNKKENREQFLRERTGR